MNLQQALQYFEGLETDFTRLWEKASTLSRLGLLTSSQKTALYQLRDALHQQQWWLVRTVRTFLSNMPALARQIPQPVKFPDLPATGAPAPAAIPVRGLGALGVAPVVVVVAVVIIAILVAGGVWLLAQSYQITTEHERELYGMRETISEARRRFDACRSSGGSVEACNQAVPIPRFQPRATRGSEGIPGWAWAGIGIGAAALILTGLYVYGSSTAPRVERGIYSLPRRLG